MNKFEDYAKRIINSLPAAEQLSQDQFQSPLEKGYQELDGPLIKVEDFQVVNGKLPNISGSEDIDEEAVENGVLVSGLEALAVYKSIHYQQAPPFQDKWGIFIFSYALKYLAREVDDYYPGKYSLTERVRKSFDLLYFHERFHYRFDSWAIAQESAQKKPLYENYRNSVYRTFHPLEYVYEESLANLHALSSISREGIFSFVKNFMLSQPGAYSNIIGVDREDFLGRLAAQTFHGRGQFMGVPARVLPEHIPFIASPKNIKVCDSWCPVYIVQEISPSRFTVPGVTLPSIKEIENGFVCGYLNGQDIGRSDHRFYRIDNGEKVKIPNPHRKNVKLCEFLNIVKKAGLVQKEFYEERNTTQAWKKNVPRSVVKPSLFRNEP